MPDDTMNRMIRRSAGREDPRTIAAAAIRAAEQAGDASALRERIATAAGLPAGMAERLVGDDAGALATDAEALVATVAELAPPRPASMSDHIRRAAGHAPAGDVATTSEPPAPTSFDGGVRESGPAPPPSMSSQIRGERQERAERRAQLGDQFDN
jgi:hypothetical protein